MENYLKENGLVWQSYNQEVSLWEWFNKADLDLIVDATALERLVHILENKGVLLIGDKEKFSSKFDVEEILKIPLKVLQIFVISPYLEIDSEVDVLAIDSIDEIYFKYVNASWRLERLESVLETEDKILGEKYIKGYKIKKIFNVAETKKDLWNALVGELESVEELLSEMLEDKGNVMFDGLLSMCAGAEIKE